MNPAAMVALIDYREIEGEERPVLNTVVIFLGIFFKFITILDGGLLSNVFFLIVVDGMGGWKF